MTDIKNLLTKQAEAIRAEDNNAKAAKLIEQAAQLLKKNQSPIKSTFMADLRATRYKRVMKFADAINKVHREINWERPLKDAGWVKVSYNTKEGREIWGHRDRREKIWIQGDKFTVKAGLLPTGVVIRSEASLEFLIDYLKK